MEGAREVGNFVVDKAFVKLLTGPDTQNPVGLPGPWVRDAICKDVSFRSSIRIHIPVSFCLQLTVKIAGTVTAG